MRYSPFLTFPDAARDAAVWIRELSELLGCDQRDAYDVLRTTMHAVRDKMSADDNAKVGNDLPLVLRGLYFEAWDPIKSHGHSDLQDLPASLLSALPHHIASDRDVFEKLLRLFERRRRHKRSTKLDLALKLCATGIDSNSPDAVVPHTVSPGLR
ncbi:MULTISPECIES: DUF2267 domain-containing protein [unclassified Rhizobium]|uniref:DUF2267 domain-containing protein n=1 Tax=unclassified Rhizobium TaxID=2613769 RepID=UPI001613BB79|nr:MULTISPECIES: DUF2267 domain-containing protein [unclassified Rhizobium]MBB3545245.1 uncharacterized protein (DUF2267 family) [Rhizobium sp. BK399]MCS3743223.1 uncharacterized protein (DUF2267 family) [Rhizobium sp. BK661]MCS4096349.1 uncharacterized protein (DUF2267 family) [Rhizobium sp. BK176]